MNAKLLIWIELLIAAACTGAINAAVNAVADPSLFTAGHAEKILLRMAIIGAIISMRDQIKHSPIQQFISLNLSNPPAIPASEQPAQVSVNTTAPVSVTAQEVLPRVNSSDPSAS